MINQRLTAVIGNGEIHWRYDGCILYLNMIDDLYAAMQMCWRRLFVLHVFQTGLQVISNFTIYFTFLSTCVGSRSGTWCNSSGVNMLKGCEVHLNKTWIHDFVSMSGVIEVSSSHPFLLFVLLSSSLTPPHHASLHSIPHPSEGRPPSSSLCCSFVI